MVIMFITPAEKGKWIKISNRLRRNQLLLVENVTPVFIYIIKLYFIHIHKAYSH